MRIIRSDKSESCSNCLYSEFARGVLFCNNSDSDLYLDNVDYCASCECWIDANEERKRK